ncbi:MAG: hypothetical protein ABR575_09850 [Actinomycetota bacterium]
MVIAARRAYSDLLRWMRGAAPGRAERAVLGRRAFLDTWLTSLAALAVIGIVSPSRFAAGARPFGDPPVSLALAVLAAVVGGSVAARHWGRGTGSPRGWTAALGSGIEHPHVEGAVGALRACPAPFRMRFTAGWVWGPALVALLGVVFALSSAYFVVDAIVARGAIEPEQLLFAAGHALLSLVTFLLGARRLGTWPLAMTVSRAAR